MSLSLGVIICTKDRAHDLERCLRSLAAQSHAPDELIVVDASTTPLAAAAWRDRLPQLVVLSSPPGLPRQRNLGLRYISTDIVAFFDDDVELGPDALSRLLAVYERHWQQGIGGVMGSDPAWAQSSAAAHWLKRLFRLTHVRQHGSRVRLYRTMGVSWIARPQREIPAQAMPGFCMSYRRQLLLDHDIFFDETLGGYADGEDVEVSARVGRLAPLWQSPVVQVRHHRSRSGRATLYRRFFTRTRNERYLHGKLFGQGWASRLAWWWGAVGRVLVALLVGLRQRSSAPLRGVLAGLVASMPEDGQSPER